MVGVGQQRKVESHHLRPGAVVLRGVVGHAEDGGTGCFEFRGSVTEPLPFERSAGGVRLRYHQTTAHFPNRSPRVVRGRGRVVSKSGAPFPLEQWITSLGAQRSYCEGLTRTLPALDEQHDFGFATRAIHAGQRPDPETGARAMPIYATTSFVFEDAQHAADLFALQNWGNIYTRIGNPTNAAFEERMASLEGGLRIGPSVQVAGGHDVIAEAVVRIAMSCAACPEPVATAPRPPSSDAILSSKAALVGLPILV